MLSPVPPAILPAFRWPRGLIAALRRHRPLIARLALVGGGLAILGCLAAQGQQATQGQQPTQGQQAVQDQKAGDAVDLRQAEQIIFDQTNRFRQQHDLEPLTRQDDLQEAAQQFARFMSENDRYGHGADGRTPAQRAEAAGYQYCIVRENIAYVTDTRDNQAQPLATQLVDGWKESPEHRESMLAEGVTEIGVAVATGRGRTFYAVQLFGRPESAAFRIELVNQSDQAVTLQTESGGNKDSMELPPRVRLRMQRCRPTTLSLADGQSSLEVRQSQTLQVVAGDDGKLTIQRTEGG